MKKLNVTIAAIEYYLPAGVEDNHKLLADNPTWNMDKLFKKIGVAKRRIAAEDQCASDLGIKAAERLIGKFGINRKKINALIFCTQAPDYFLPTTACIMQERLGLETSTASFDINLGCSGYIYGLAVGASLIESGLCSNVLLVCADTYTKYVSKTDRTCRPIFGDAGAATLLVRSKKKGVLGPFILGSDGKGASNLIVSGGANRNRDELPILKMDGPEVFMFTMSRIPQDVSKLVRQAGLKIDDINQFFFHQASKVVLDNIARRLSIPDNKMFRGYKNIGNTVSASIPIALKQAVDKKKLKAKDRIVLAGFGVGYSWGACVVEWGKLGGKI